MGRGEVSGPTWKKLSLVTSLYDDHNGNGNDFKRKMVALISVVKGISMKGSSHK